MLPFLFLTLVAFCIGFGIENDDALQTFGVLGATADGFEYMIRTHSFSDDIGAIFHQVEDRPPLSPLNTDNADLIIYLRLANVGKDKILGLSPEDVKIAAMVSLRQSMLVAARDGVRMQLIVIYDTLSFGNSSLLQSTQSIVEKLFAGTPTLAELKHVTLTASNGGNRATNLLQYQLAVEQDFASNPIIYFLEEDYLHRESALREIVQMLQFNQSCFVTGFDHPDRYWKGSPHGKPRLGLPGDRGHGLSYIISHPEKLDRHWRTVDSTTMTFAMRFQTFLATSHVFEALAPRDMDIWPLIDEMGYWLWSPIPCLVSHMHYQTCFYLDWERMTAENLKYAKNVILK